MILINKQILLMYRTFLIVKIDLFTNNLVKNSTFFAKSESDESK